MKFRREEAIQAILYILQKMGGTCDMHKCNKILYFADNEYLSKYGRPITGDSYIAMDFGPVPSSVYDLLKAVRGEGYFSSMVDNVRNTMFRFVNKKDIVSLTVPDLEYLSDSDIEILDKYIEFFRDKSFEDTTKASHGYAWSNTRRNSEISLRDRLTECGDSDAYIDYIEKELELEKEFC